MPWASEKEVLKHYRMLTRSEAFVRTVMLSVVIAAAIQSLYLAAPRMSLFVTICIFTMLLNTLLETWYPASNYEPYRSITTGGSASKSDAPATTAPSVTEGKALPQQNAEASAKEDEVPYYQHQLPRASIGISDYLFSREGVTSMKLFGALAIAYPVTQVIYKLPWQYTVAICLVVTTEESYETIKSLLAYIDRREIDEFPPRWQEKLMQRFQRKFSDAQGYYFIGMYGRKRVGLPRMSRFMHTLIAAPTGEGKSTAMIIPQLLCDAESRGSALVPDMKSPELYNIVSGRWIKYNKRAYLFDPWDPDTVGINFLPGALDKDKLVIVAALMAENDEVVEQEQAFFKSRTKYLLYAILTLVQSFHEEYCTLATAYFAVQSVDTLQSYISAADPDVEALFSDYDKFSKQDKLNALTAIREKLDVFMSSDVRKAFSRKEFDLKWLFESHAPCLLVLGAPMDQEEPGTRIASMITNLVINMAFREGRIQKGNQRRGEKAQMPSDLYLYLDELRNLRVEGLAKLVAIARGIRTHIIASVTDLGFLRFYHKGVDFSSLMGNFRTKIFMRGLDLASCREISDSLGKMPDDDYKWVRSDIMVSDIEKQMLEPNNIMHLDDDIMIVFTPKTDPFPVQKSTIHNTKWLKDMQVPPPTNIRALYEQWGIAKKPLQDPEIPTIGGLPDFEKMKSGKPPIESGIRTVEAYHRETGGGTVRMPNGGQVPLNQKKPVPDDDSATVQ